VQKSARALLCGLRVEPPRARGALARRFALVQNNTKIK
jgi:hypothetical protein